MSDLSKLARQFSGLCCPDLGRCFGGIGGPAVTMRRREVLRYPPQNPQFAKDRTACDIRGKIMNSDPESSRRD